MTTTPDNQVDIKFTGRCGVEALLDFRLQPGKLFAATLLMQDGCDDCGIAVAIRALAPDLPAAHYSWGVALARHNDLDAAASKFNVANQKGPHWADPLKAWGDVLMKQGHSKEALHKYEQALKFAPNWKQLKQARDALAGQKS